MSEFTATTNYGKFQYPSHFKYPEGSENYFLQHHFHWKEILKQIETDEPRSAIEIGSLHGGCSVWLMENYLNREGDTLQCIDINETEYLKNNLSPYKNATLHKRIIFRYINSDDSRTTKQTICQFGLY